MLYQISILGENLRIEGRFLAKQISRLDEDFDPDAAEIQKYEKIPLENKKTFHFVT